MTQRTTIEQIERTRNLLAFLLVASFISIIPAAMIVVIPEANRDLITYMVGQLSGMALTVLGFYFINKVGADALDAKRADNTNKMADAVIAAAGGVSGTAQADATAAADAVAGAAVDEAERIKGEG